MKKLFICLEKSHFIMLSFIVKITRCVKKGTKNFPYLYELICCFPMNFFFFIHYRYAIQRSCSWKPVNVAPDALFAIPYVHPAAISTEGIAHRRPSAYLTALATHEQARVLGSRCSGVHVVILHGRLWLTQTGFFVIDRLRGARLFA